MFSSDRNELRKTFFTTWHKHLSQQPLTSFEMQIVEVIREHQEYHIFFDNLDNQNKEFYGENPFLHLSLHLALRDQIATDRPLGIRAVFQTLQEKYLDKLITEHKMIECLEKILWEAQRTHAEPDEKAYLENLKNL